MASWLKTSPFQVIQSKITAIFLWIHEVTPLLYVILQAKIAPSRFKRDFSSCWNFA